MGRANLALVLEDSEPGDGEVKECFESRSLEGPTQQRIQLLPHNEIRQESNNSSSLVKERNKHTHSSPSPRLLVMLVEECTGDMVEEEEEEEKHPFRLCFW